MKTIPWFLSLLGVAALTASAQEDTILWKAGADGYHTFRIPSLLVTAKGTVLALCEGRKTGAGDHGDVDLVLKRSTDGGRSWTATQLVHEEGGDAPITIGNPCPVEDVSTGTIWLPFCRDNKSVWITSSTDGGVTWARPRDLGTTAVRPDWDWVATGPGIGIQLKSGRLVIPCDHKRALASEKPEWNSHLLFSDDHGATWQIGAPIQAGGNECQVIERRDGSLLVNARMQGHFEGFRGIASSADSGGTFTALENATALPCPKCQGSLIRYDDATLLFCNPRPPKPVAGKPGNARADLTLRLSHDDGATWPVSRLLHAGPSAYSCLGRLPDGTILCLYEGGEKAYHEGIRLARFGMDWVHGKE